MKREAILEYYIQNGEILSTQNQDMMNLRGQQAIYEVIRVIDGIALYFEEHMDRMRKSAEILGHGIHKSDTEIFQEIQELIKVNHSPDLNIKLLCSDLDQKNQAFILYFVESHYPAEEVYQKGIHTILFQSERENPNAKVVNQSLRERVQQAIKAEGAYEALLVNHEQYITEGSRSNIFFVKGNQLITAPPGDVLLGVTRMRIMEVCKKLGIAVKENLLHVDDLLQLDGAFMTGTSVNVMPIRSIDSRVYDSSHHSLIQKIHEGYEEDMKAYIEMRKARD